MAHLTTPEAEALLDVNISVLDHGFVRMVDYMGNDKRIVQSARVSYGDGTKSLREDEGLINYLMKNLHTSPFEQVSLVFHIKLPLFVFAQLVRHRTAKLNSMSARYSVMADEFYIPGADELRGQSETNKQVGEGAVPTLAAEIAAATIKNHSEDSYALYEDVLDRGLSREQARMVLPQNLYTQIYWKVDLHNLFHFLRLRLDWHAQQEIRVYGEALARCAQAVAPMAYAAFEEHLLHAQRFSRQEMVALQMIMRHEPDDEVTAYLGQRAKDEFDKKLWSSPQ